MTGSQCCSPTTQSKRVVNGVIMYNAACWQVLKQTHSNNPTQEGALPAFLRPLSRAWHDKQEQLNPPRTRRSQYHHKQPKERGGTISLAKARGQEPSTHPAWKGGKRSCRLAKAITGLTAAIARLFQGFPSYAHIRQNSKETAEQIRVHPSLKESTAPVLKITKHRSFSCAWHPSLPLWLPKQLAQTCRSRPSSPNTRLTTPYSLPGSPQHMAQTASHC